LNMASSIFVVGKTSLFHKQESILKGDNSSLLGSDLELIVFDIYEPKMTH